MEVKLVNQSELDYILNLYESPFSGEHLDNDHDDET